MSLSGERLVIAATIDHVKEGDTFDELPLHMPVLDQFSITEPNRFNRLLVAMDVIFKDGQSSLTVAARPKQRKGLYAKGDTFSVDGLQTPARLIQNVNKGPWFGLRSLAEGLGEFEQSYPFRNVKDQVTRKETFFAHIADTSEQSIENGEQISFSSVALFGITGALQNQQARVIKNIPFGSNNG